MSLKYSTSTEHCQEAKRACNMTQKAALPPTCEHWDRKAETMESMTDAEATVRLAILEGLIRSAHITGVMDTRGDVLINDIMQAIFDPGVRWAIRDYLEEIEGKGR